MAGGLGIGDAVKMQIQMQMKMEAIAAQVERVAGRRSSDAQLEIIRQIYCSFGDYQQEI